MCMQRCIPCPIAVKRLLSTLLLTSSLCTYSMIVNLLPPDRIPCFAEDAFSAELTLFVRDKVDEVLQREGDDAVERLAQNIDQVRLLARLIFIISSFTLFIIQLTPLTPPQYCNSRDWQKNRSFGKTAVKIVINYLEKACSGLQYWAVPHHVAYQLFNHFVATHHKHTVYML